MHPAFSVIFFTTMSGAGYGLLALMGLGGYFQFLPTSNPLFGGIGIGLALALVTAGLLASTFHLGHPERAWRAMSQWKTSWLSREGLCAVITYLPALAMARGWVIKGSMEGYFGVMGLITTILAAATVYTTSMIYASLKTIRMWHNRYVPLLYLLLAAMTGLILLSALLWWFDVQHHAVTQATLISILLTASAKVTYWRQMTNAKPQSTTESATGLGQYGKVTMVQSPHSHDNYLLKEMGFQIGRKHSQKLRRIALLCAFVLPCVFTALTLYSNTGTLWTTLAVLSAALGVVTERWLFFAEAKHTVSLYYSL